MKWSRLFLLVIVALAPLPCGGSAQSTVAVPLAPSTIRRDQRSYFHKKVTVAGVVQHLQYRPRSGYQFELAGEDKVPVTVWSRNHPTTWDGKTAVVSGVLVERDGTVGIQVNDGPALNRALLLAMAAFVCTAGILVYRLARSPSGRPVGRR